MKVVTYHLDILDIIVLMHGVKVYRFGLPISERSAGEVVAKPNIDRLETVWKKQFDLYVPILTMPYSMVLYPYPVGLG
jgi:hypothetical protein